MNFKTPRILFLGLVMVLRASFLQGAAANEPSGAVPKISYAQAHYDFARALIFKDFNTFKAIFDRHKHQGIGIALIDTCAEPNEKVKQQPVRTIVSSELLEFIDNQFVYPLTFAAFFGDLRMINILSKEHPRHIDIRYNEEETPLMIAARYGREPAVDLLLQLGANPKLKYKSKDAFEIALDAGHKKVAKNIYKHSPTFQRAIMFDDIKEIKQMLEDNPQIIHEKLDSDGTTPFMKAVQFNAYKVAEYLAHQGITISAATILGKTAYDFSPSEKMTNFIKSLEHAISLEKEEIAAREIIKKQPKAKPSQEVPSALEGVHLKENDEVKLALVREEKRKKSEHERRLAKEERRKVRQEQNEAKKAEEDQKKIIAEKLEALKEAERKEKKRIKKEQRLQRKAQESALEIQKNSEPLDPKQTLESALPKQFFIEESLFLNQAGWIAWISSHVLEIGDREKVIGALREIFQSVKDPTRILGIPAGSYSLDAMLDICCDLLPKLQSYTRKNNR